MSILAHAHSTICRFFIIIIVNYLLPYYLFLNINYSFAFIDIRDTCKKKKYHRNSISLYYISITVVSHSISLAIILLTDIFQYVVVEKYCFNIPFINMWQY